MTRRPAILIGMAAGGLWAIGIVELGRRLPVLAPMPGDQLTTLAVALLPGGLVLIALIARLATRRFFDDTLIDGQPLSNPGDLRTQAVLTNTVEQLLMAVCTWPFIGLVLGQGIIVVMGASFGITRIAFWIGYAISPPLRAFGFAGGFYPTILSTLLALVIAAEHVL